MTESHGPWRAEFDRRLRVVARIPDDATDITTTLASEGAIATECTFDSGYQVVRVAWKTRQGHSSARTFDLGDLLRDMDAVPAADA